MNTEIKKAIEQKTKNHPVRDWWKKNDYKVYRIIFFPVYIGAKITDKIKTKIRRKQVWSNERADKVLTYYIPRRAHWNEEKREFYFYDNGMGWNIYSAKKYLKRKDRRWWKAFNGLWGGKIRPYLINEFELEGFTKEIIGLCEDDTEIIFKENP